MKIKNTIVNIDTKKIFDFVDITDKIKKFIEESQIKDGLINIQLFNTSAGLILNENEPLLLEDIKENLEKTAPQDAGYKHDDMTVRTVNVCEGECINGHSHCKAIHLLPSIALNIIDRKLQLGMWQRAMLVELDRPRSRKIQLQIIGI